MKTPSVICAVLGAVVLAVPAIATVSMSFADPIPGRQLHNQAGGSGPGIGLLTYDTAAPITFLFDGTEDALPNHVFGNARVQLSMSIGSSSTLGGVTTAPVVGFFRIFDADTSLDIVTGTAGAGTFVRISSTNSILFSGPSFTYLAGSALTAITGPIVFSDPSEAVLTLTNVIAADGGFFINPDGSFKTFDANASFTGDSQSGPVVPASGSLALGAIGSLCAARRARKRGGVSGING